MPTNPHDLRASVCLTLPYSHEPTGWKERNDHCKLSSEYTPITSSEKVKAGPGQGQGYPYLRPCPGPGVGVGEWWRYSTEEECSSHMFTAPGLKPRTMQRKGGKCRMCRMAQWVMRLPSCLLTWVCSLGTTRERTNSHKLSYDMHIHSLNTCICV